MHFHLNASPPTRLSCLPFSLCTSAHFSYLTMRIRKRYQNPLPPPDLSSPLPPSAAAAAAAAAVAPPVAATGGATRGKEGEAMAADAAAARILGDGCGDGEGRGLHPNGSTTNPTTCLPFRPPPSAAATAGGAERGDLPPPGRPLPTRDVLFAHGHGREVPRREQDGENGGDIGEAHRRWNTAAHSGDNAPAPKSLGAKASEVSVGHGGHNMLPSGAAAALAAAEAMVRWSGEEGESPPKKRRGGYHARGRSLGLEEEKENVVAEREMKQPRLSKASRRRTATSSTTTMAATGTVLTSAGTGNRGVPTAIGDGAGAAEKCYEMVVKEEGGDVMPAAAAALVDGNRGVGNGKKRRSPAVLMEGSRCSRVNGRGWRCCQQTLVGYSLCEHHLGKGRLRSVSSVRCNGRARKKEDLDDGAAPPLPSLLRQPDHLLSGDGEDEEEEKPGKRRRNKIGMVKARSISSLLHQPDHPTPRTIAAPEPFPISVPTPARYTPSDSSSSTTLCHRHCGGVNQCR